MSDLKFVRDPDGAGVWRRGRSRPPVNLQRYKVFRDRDGEPQHIGDVEQFIVDIDRTAKGRRYVISRHSAVRWTYVPLKGWHSSHRYETRREAAGALLQHFEADHG